MAIVLRPPDSQESLSDNLADLGRFRKRVAVAAGLFAFTAVTLSFAFVVCAFDSAYRLPPLARVFALVGLLTLGGVYWIRGVSRAFALRTDPLSVALELEDKYPNLNDALASAVSFLEAGDATARGISNRLQEAAVKSARRAADRHDFDKLVPTGKCWRAGWTCAGVLTVVIPFALADTTRSGTALTRLAEPFGSHTYPTKTRVDVLTPEKLPARFPRGEAFELKFAVRGVIKDRASVTFRVAGGEEFTEEYPLSAGNDPQFASSAVVTARFDASRLSSSFTFRIVSNDFEGDWQKVDVVPPPRLVPMGGRPGPLFHITPPEYTGLPAINLPDGAAAIEVPVGTVVRMRASTDVRLGSASIVFAGDKTLLSQTAGLAHLGHLNPISAYAAQELADSMGSDIPVSLDGTAKNLTAMFAPSLTGVYSLKLTDETGLAGTRLLEIRLLSDPAPTVTLLRPSAGRDPAVLVPGASVPIHVAADDKTYAVRRTFIEYRVGRNGAVRIRPLEDMQAVARALPGVVGGFAAWSHIRPTTVEPKRPLLVPLSEFTRDDGSPLRDGDSLFLRGAADDWDDLTPVKEPGRSGEVEIRIASPESIEAWLQRELAGLRPDLIRLRDQQQRARQQAAEVVPRPDGTLLPADRDRLLASEQAQRQIRGKIADARDGIRAKTDALRETILANKLPRTNTTSRVDAIAEELGRIADRELPAIEPNLSDARQLGSQSPRAGQEKAVSELLKKALRHQKATEDGLTDILDTLAVWGAAGDIRSEARVLRDFVLRQAVDIEKMDRVALLTELDRAGTRADQAADQGNQLLGRADRLAAEKEKQATTAKGTASEKSKEAASLRAQAVVLPPGTPDKSTLNAKASVLEGDAADLQASATKGTTEAEALRRGIRAAGGQSLTVELRDAADAARKDKRSDAISKLRSAASRLDKLIDELTEKVPETAPDLVKLQKQAADDLDDLAAAQEELRKRSVEAAMITDAMKREAALKALAADQDKLIERGRELVQRLTREQADSTAREVRAAVDRMDAARNDLEAGNPGIRAQNDAIEKLDGARDKLDAATTAAPQQLNDEKRRKMADKIKALLERQKSAVTEADRIHKLVATNKGWKRDQETAYLDVASKREDEIAKEVRLLAEKEFAPLPVFARLLTESAAAMDSAAAKITNRLKENDPALAYDAELEVANDRRVNRPMSLATRRLEQLLDALKQDDPKSNPKKEQPPKTPPDPKNPMPPPAGGGDQDVVSPMAQLKVLRSLQAELNLRTAEFAKLHPDADKLTDEEREELKELEDAQKDIAALFEHMAKLFQEQKQQQEKQEKPAQEKQEKPAQEKP